MFNNPGAKIKGLATTLFWIEVIGIVIGLIATEMIEEPIAAILALVVGVGIAYLSALFLAAFGELVQTNTDIKESNAAILAKLNAPAEN